MFIITIIISALIAVSIKWWLRNKKYFDLASKFQEPVGYNKYPLIGHAHHYTPDAVFKIATSFTSSYGVLYLGNRIIYYLNHPDLIEFFKNNDKCLDKPYYFDYNTLVRGGVFLARGDAWKNRRKLLNKTFKLSLLRSYGHMFTNNDLNLAKQLESNIGKIFDIHDVTFQSTFEKYFECALGIKDKCYNQEYLKAVKIVMETTNTRIFTFVHTSDFIYRYTKSWKKIEENIKIANEISRNALNTRRDKRNSEQLSEVIAEDQENKQSKIFLDFLLDCVDNNEFTEDEVLCELNTFIFAACDTTTTAFSFICILLALHPEENVYQEIKDVLGHKDFQYSDISKFKYIRCVIKESLRMFPATTISERVTSEDVQIGEYIFPEGSIVSVNVANIHYSEKYYKNPTQFDPDRFNPDLEECKRRHKYAFLSFMAGKRNCIGENFAYLALFSQITTIFKRFRFETTYKRVEDIKIKQQFLIVPIDGFPVKFFQRI